jgi:putative transposase
LCFLTKQLLILPHGIKSVKQSYSPAPEVVKLMEAFRQMVNNCLRKGLGEDASTLKRLSKLCYHDLKSNYPEMPSYYYLTAISKAAGFLASRKKSIKRGVKTKEPYLRKPILVSCYGLRIEDGCLLFPVSRNSKRKSIPLTRHTLSTIQGVEFRSFTITPTSVSISIRKEAPIYGPKSFLGVDRNASNVTCGNSARVLQINLSKVEKIASTTRDIVQSFKRNDSRIRRVIASKYGRRRKNRINQILHPTSRAIVEDAMNNEAAIILEDIRGIRNLYKKGNYQARNFRARMNSVPWGEIKRQLEYKAAWEGVPLIHLTKSETRGTSSHCYQCGERLQGDRARKRQRWCQKCKRWLDRDVVAVMNISRKGWLRFGQSKGEACEAMVQERGLFPPPILKVDASKLSARRGVTLLQQTRT